jgi:hypothetical protein
MVLHADDRPDTKTPARTVERNHRHGNEIALHWDRSSIDRARRRLWIRPQLIGESAMRSVEQRIRKPQHDRHEPAAGSKE